MVCDICNVVITEIADALGWFLGSIMLVLVFSGLMYFKISCRSQPSRERILQQNHMAHLNINQLNLKHGVPPLQLSDVVRCVWIDDVQMRQAVDHGMDCYSHRWRDEDRGQENGP